MPSARPRWSSHTTAGSAEAAAAKGQCSRTSSTASALLDSSRLEALPGDERLEGVELVGGGARRVAAGEAAAGFEADLTGRAAGLEQLEQQERQLLVGAVAAPRPRRPRGRHGTAVGDGPARPAAASSSVSTPASHSLARCWRMALWFSPKCSVSSATVTGLRAAST